MSDAILTLQDLIRALDSFQSYQAIDVFGSDVQEVRTNMPVAGLQKVNERSYHLVRGGRIFQLDWFPERNVLRLRRSTQTGNASVAGVGAAAGAAIGAAVSDQKSAGVLVGALLGLLVGSAIGATGETRVFTLALEPQSRQWLAYDGGLVPWMKEQLFVPGTA